MSFENPICKYLLVINSNLGPHLLQFARYGHVLLWTFHLKLRPNRCR